MCQHILLRRQVLILSPRMSSNVQSQSSCLFMSLLFCTAAWLMSCQKKHVMESVQCLVYGQLRLFVQRNVVLMYVCTKNGHQEKVNVFL